MNKNLNSPSKLTEFAPLKTEEKPQTVGEFISRFFKLSNPFAAEESNTPPNDASSQDLPSWVDTSETLCKEIPYNVDVTEGRSLPNVLKRISNLLALKSNNLQNYGDTELKQYWMPDSVSKQCYECSEKFTTFRRKHHCRVCGQIFCSSCCNQQIPGKIFGCTGDLRVCTYCCKIVLSYLSSDLGTDLTTDLKVLQENLRTKLSIASPVSPSKFLQLSSSQLKTESSDGPRKSLIEGYQEEMFASGVSSCSSVLSSEEKCRAYQNSSSLRNLFEEISKPISGIALGCHRYHLKTYFDCFLGSELVDWLIYQQKASNRIQANAICQALLEGNYIECLSETTTFIDSYVLYRLGKLPSPDCPPPSNVYDIPTQEEPMWVQQIIQDSNIVDSDSDQIPPLLKTSSSYMLDLNVEANTVYLSKPLSSPQNTLPSESNETDYHDFGDKLEVRTSEQREFAPESGWHNASSLREENGEKEAYRILTNAYDQHEQTLMKQILATNCLSLSWSNILLPLIHDIVTLTRPDKNHDARDLDIRHYVQIKKLPGGLKKDTRVIEGIVFTKNVAHKGMSQDIENPKILLLQGAIVYQRTEGRFMSLEPVLMQENEYLRNVCARIIALQPDIVMVQRNVSRLAQDFLREKGITLVHNVKQKLLDRLSTCINADLVGSLDAHIGRPRLGTCKRFYLNNFIVSKDQSYKTLMFLEGLPNPHLGSTVLLRGASKLELSKIKKIFSFILFATYNWRLEKSFLMDEFAQPPDYKCEFFDEGKELSPIQISKRITEKSCKEVSNRKEELILKNNISQNDEKIPFSTQISNEDRNLTVQSVNDFSDPLHSSYDNDSSIMEQHQLSVSELPFSNKFRKALDDTMLCVSPYVIFPIPYLETEPGKKCLLRKFFPTEIYHSQQFDANTKARQKEIEIDDSITIEKPEMKPPHPFTTAKFVTSVDANEIQNLLANFRACGGRIEKKNSILKCTKTVEVPVKEDQKEKIDVLDPLNHQRLAVLFCNFRIKSQNAPAFCMNPGVVYMDFYGRNDIPLGCFLEKYCFREAYTCPSNTCGTSMVQHVRRFVHNLGCVSIFLKCFESGFSEENIVMWSSCSKCQSVSPFVPMSTDTWSFSFAKYLELKFHGSKYTPRGNTPCQHSLHHDHYQYFGYKNYVASFSYSPIEIWEISLPPPVIKLNVDLELQHQMLIDDIKELAQKGHDIFSAISEKISVITNIPESINSLKELWTKDKVLFRQKIEEVQLKLTSPSVEEKEFNINETKKAYYRLSDRIVLVKRCLVEIVDNWNVRLTLEADKKKDVDKKRDSHTISESESVNNDTTSQKSEVELSQSLGIVGEQLQHTEASNGDVSVAPPKPYQKAQSDLSVSCDLGENKREFDKKSVKMLLSQLLPSSTPSNMINNPYSVHEHFNLQSGIYATLTVSEDDLSSIIAYALNSHELARLVEDLRQPPTSVDISSSPGNKRRSQSEKDGEEKNGGLLGFLRNKDSKTELLNSTTCTIQPEGSVVSQPIVIDAVGDSKKLHLDVVFENATCNFLCRIYYAEKFAALRNAVLPDGEEIYIRSLSKSSPWDARGGKSGSAFTKTTDDRFILKEMSKNEVNLFLESAANYFTYMHKCYTSDQPTLLGKIVGIYQIIFKNNANGHQMRKNLLVMENLFYNRVVSQKFDLKGSIRNRLVIPDNQGGEIVLLDENLLKMTCDSPLYILPHSKAVLSAAIENDTDFLASQSVMDYSLLVGLDSEKKELVLGIIGEFLHKFTAFLTQKNYYD